MTVEERRPRHAVRGMDVPTSRPRFGCHLEASRSGHATGSIGKIDEATNDTGSSSVVVDTGPWIFGRKVVILAGGPGTERLRELHEGPDQGLARVRLVQVRRGLSDAG